MGEQRADALTGGVLPLPEGMFWNLSLLKGSKDDLKYIGIYCNDPEPPSSGSQWYENTNEITCNECGYIPNDGPRALAGETCPMCQSKNPDKTICTLWAATRVLRPVALRVSIASLSD